MMNDTTQTTAAPPEVPEAPQAPTTSRRKAALVTLVAVAAVAVVALGVVAVVAVTRGNTTATMMGTGSQMMDGHMTGGHMMGQDQSNSTIAGAHEIGVSSSSFRFDPAEIHVRAGEDVTVVLTTSDTVHDFTIDELGFHVAAAPGEDGRGSFHAPSSPGRYTAYCSVAGHRQAGMTATVVVDPA